MIRVVCIGDSITAGQHLGEGEPRWVDLLAGYEVEAAGVPGDTTRLGLERFPSAVQSREPDVVVIQFGHNDANRWPSDHGVPRVSARAFSANLHEMIDRARSFAIEPFLCSLTPTWRSPQLEEDTRRYDGLLRAVAEDTGTALIDIRAAFMGIDELLLDDGLHLSGRGHRVYADGVQRALDAWNAR